jgi:hypothetical protein
LYLAEGVVVGEGLRAKVAVTLLGAVIFTVHISFPEHAPPQPVKTELAYGEALRVTYLFESNIAEPPEQPAIQFIPIGLLTTAPLPLPSILRDRLYLAEGVVVEEGGGLGIEEAVGLGLAPLPSKIIFAL